MKTVEAIIPQIAYLINFVTKHDERERTLEEVQSERHQENRDKLEEINAKIAKKTLYATIQAVVWTAAGVIVAILALLVTIRFATRSELVNPFHLFSQHIERASVTQHAKE